MGEIIRNEQRMKELTKQGWKMKRRYLGLWRWWDPKSQAD